MVSSMKAIEEKKNSIAGFYIEFGSVRMYQPGMTDVLDNYTRQPKWQAVLTATERGLIDGS